MNLIDHFVHEVEEEDDSGRRTGKRNLIFPRYHQLDSVRRLIEHARTQGAGHRYLIQHSAGSGKSFTISWLAHQLSVLHDDQDRRVFDSVVVVSDRRVIDRQLQEAILQFEQVSGVVENIDQTSRQLKQALESGKNIVVSTLQKYPVIAEQISALPGQRFAVLIDEAHSSQSGETAKSLKAVLGVSSLEEAEREEAAAATPEEELEERVLAEAQKRGPQPNLSTFAFTATPKERTLELFGTPDEQGRFFPFSLYSMRQAIEENFILDVLENYTTYQVYWKLLKKVEDDPRYDRNKASSLLRAFVDLHEHAIRQKVQIIAEHFHDHSAACIGGQARAMVVTRSRLHAVRYYLSLQQYLKEQGRPYQALVAFSGTVRDRGVDYTEAGMNGFSERQTAKAFRRPEYRFLVVANKFQTGFDEPLLHTMYVDKKLGGVGAVQTLSRLNRTRAQKESTLVLDFANAADEIEKAFQPYYECTLLSEATDPNLLYDLENELLQFGVFTEPEVEGFAGVYFDPAAQGSRSQREQWQARVHTALEPYVQRARGRSAEELHDLRVRLQSFVRLYAFLSQVLTFQDPGLEKLYEFCRLLRRRLPLQRQALPREVQEAIDMESYRVQQQSRGKIALETRNGPLTPRLEKAPGSRTEEHLEPLSEIIRRLNERFGTEFTAEERLTLEHISSKLEQDAALDASVRVNSRDNARLTFDQKLHDLFQGVVDSNFQFYKRFTDNRPFGTMLAELLFNDYLQSHRQIEDLIGQGESKMLEFKSTLRWSVKEQRKDNLVTHATLKTIAAFLNTDGGDLLIGVADDGSLVGIDADGFDSHDKFLRHLAQTVRNALGVTAGTLFETRIQVLDGHAVCLVSCQRGPEPVFLKWKGLNTDEEGDFFVRSGPGTVKLSKEEQEGYIRTRFNPSTG